MSNEKKTNEEPLNKVDDVQKRMVRDFGVNPSEIKLSPLQKSYHDMTNDDNKLGHFICVQMNLMMKKHMIPSWNNFCSTATWAIMGMNLSEPLRYKFGNKWKEIYDAVKITESTAEPEKKE